METRRSRFFYGYVVVAAAFTIWTIGWGTFTSFGVFFKPLLTELGWTRAMTSGAYSLSLFVRGLLGIAAGRLTDRFGPRIVMVVSGLLVGLGFLLMSQVNSIWQLYLFFGVMVGIGLSSIFAVTLSIIARWFVKRRGMMMGIVTAGGGIGGAIFAPLAGWLILTYGWRTSYIIMGIIALVFLIVAALFLRRDPRQMGQLPYGADEVKGGGLDVQAGGLSLREAIYTRQFWMLCAMYFSFGFCRNTTNVHIVPHATDLGFSLTIGATTLAIITASTTISRIIMGSATDRIGSKRAFAFSFILMPVVFFWLMAAKELWMLYLFAIVFGFGWGGLAAGRAPMSAEIFGLSSLGVLLGIFEFGASIGGAIGPLLAGWIFDIVSSYQGAFLACAILGIIGFILTSLLRPITKQGEN